MGSPAEQTVQPVGLRLRKAGRAKVQLHIRLPFLERFLVHLNHRGAAPLPRRFPVRTGNFSGLVRKLSPVGLQRLFQGL